MCSTAVVGVDKNEHDDASSAEGVFNARFLTGSGFIRGPLVGRGGGEARKRGKIQRQRCGADRINPLTPSAPLPSPHHHHPPQLRHHMAGYLGRLLPFTKIVNRLSD